MIKILIIITLVFLSFTQISFSVTPEEEKAQQIPQIINLVNDLMGEFRKKRSETGIPLNAEALGTFTPRCISTIFHFTKACKEQNIHNILYWDEAKIEYKQRETFKQHSEVMEVLTKVLDAIGTKEDQQKAYKHLDEALLDIEETKRDNDNKFFTAINIDPNDCTYTNLMRKNIRKNERKLNKIRRLYTGEIPKYCINRTKEFNEIDENTSDGRYSALRGRLPNRLTQFCFTEEFINRRITDQDERDEIAGLVLCKQAYCTSEDLKASDYPTGGCVPKYDNNKYRRCPVGPASRVKDPMPWKYFGRMKQAYFLHKSNIEISNLAQEQITYYEDLNRLQQTLSDVASFFTSLMNCYSLVQKIASTGLSQVQIYDPLNLPDCINVLRTAADVFSDLVSSSLPPGTSLKFESEMNTLLSSPLKKLELLREVDDFLQAKGGDVSNISNTAQLISCIGKHIGLSFKPRFFSQLLRSLSLIQKGQSISAHDDLKTAMKGDFSEGILTAAVSLLNAAKDWYVKREKDRRDAIIKEWKGTLEIAEAQKEHWKTEKAKSKIHLATVDGLLAELEDLKKKIGKTCNRENAYLKDMLAMIEELERKNQCGNTSLGGIYSLKQKVQSLWIVPGVYFERKELPINEIDATISLWRRSATERVKEIFSAAVYEQSGSINDAKTAGEPIDDSDISAIGLLWDNNEIDSESFVKFIENLIADQFSSCRLWLRFKNEKTHVVFRLLKKMRSKKASALLEEYRLLQYPLEESASTYQKDRAYCLKMFATYYHIRPGIDTHGMSVAEISTDPLVLTVVNAAGDFEGPSVTHFPTIEAAMMWYMDSKREWHKGIPLAKKADIIAEVCDKHTVVSEKEKRVKYLCSFIIGFKKLLNQKEVDTIANEYGSLEAFDKKIAKLERYLYGKTQKKGKEGGQLGKLREIFRGNYNAAYFFYKKVCDIEFKKDGKRKYRLSNSDRITKKDLIRSYKKLTNDIQQAYATSIEICKAEKPLIALLFKRENSVMLYRKYQEHKEIYESTIEDFNCNRWL